MPELPEVETIVRGLEPRLKGARVASFRIFDPSVLRETRGRELVVLKEKRIQGVRRRGKMILVDFEDGWQILFHLKMTGQLLLAAPEAPADKHVRLIIRLQKGDVELRFRDIRKFGFLRCSKSRPGFTAPEVSRLGPEPLDLDFPSFRRRFQGRRGRIKSLLLDQSFIAGVGNIYADEMLFKAGIHPWISARDLKTRTMRILWKAMRTVLEEAISLKGSSVRDYIDADGQEGGFQSFHQAYGREGQGCRRCGTPIRRIKTGGRSTFFCPRCQNLGRH